jgi:hypothetical protein
MKSLVLAAALSCLAAVGCGSSGGQQCQTAACGAPSTQSYQLCATPGQGVSTATYNGTSCNIETPFPDGGLDSASQACATAVANYCGM